MDLLTNSLATLPPIVEDAIQTVFRSYKKLIRINAIEGSYESIIEPTPVVDTNKTPDIYSWCKLSVGLGEIHYQDADAFLKFMNPINLRTYFKTPQDRKKIFRYRRLSSEGTFRWVALELFPSVEFTKENQIIILCVRDIHDDYTYQLVEQRKMYYLSTHDASSGLKNRLAFMDDIMQNLEDYRGVITIRSTDNILDDIETILSQKITDISDIYSMNTTDIIILIRDKDSERFLENFWNLKNNLKNTLVGYYYTSQLLNINEALFEAEEMMYER